MKPVTIPAVLHMSLRTGQLVERPSLDKWTEGDIEQWDSEHECFVRERDAKDAAEYAREHHVGVIEEQARMIAELEAKLAVAREGAQQASRRAGETISELKGQLLQVSARDVTRSEARKIGDSLLEQMVKRNAFDLPPDFGWPGKRGGP